MTVTNNFIPSEKSETQSLCHYVCNVLIALLSTGKMWFYSNILKAFQ